VVARVVFPVAIAGAGGIARAGVGAGTCAGGRGEGDALAALVEGGAFQDSREFGGDRGRDGGIFVVVVVVLILIFCSLPWSLSRLQRPAGRTGQFRDRRQEPFVRAARADRAAAAVVVAVERGRPRERGVGRLLSRGLVEWAPGPEFAQGGVPGEFRGGRVGGGGGGGGRDGGGGGALGVGGEAGFGGEVSTDGRRIGGVAAVGVVGVAVDVDTHGAVVPVGVEARLFGVVDARGGPRAREVERGFGPGDVERFWE